MSLIADAKAMHEQLIAWRRDFHTHPELGFRETRTTAILTEFCRQIGLDVTSPINQTGVMAVLDVPGAEGTLALRADIDALAMEELNETDYSSQNAGVMHACGHDSHTAMLMGAIRLLVERKAELKHRVKFFFQPNEETPPGGAKDIIEAGHLDDVDEVFAIHVFSGLTAGKVGIRPGPIMAATDSLKIHIAGRGGHAAAPETTVDPIVVAAHIITALQTIVSRGVQPVEPAVVSICQLNAGTAFNVIPDFAVMGGTVRSLDEHVRKHLHRQIERIAHRVAQAFGAKATTTIESGYPVTVNDPACVERIEKLVRETVSIPDPVVRMKPKCGGEDFSYFLAKTRGAIAFLGSAGEETATHYGHHNPHFDIDESILPIGSALLAGFCMR